MSGEVAWVRLRPHGAEHYPSDAASMSYPLSTALGLSTGSSIVAAILATALGATFAAADSAIGALPATRIAALLEQDDVPHRATLERIRDRGDAMRATYLVGRLLASAV